MNAPRCYMGGLMGKNTVPVNSAASKRRSLSLGGWLFILFMVLTVGTFLSLRLVRGPALSPFSYGNDLWDLYNSLRMLKWALTFPLGWLAEFILVQVNSPLQLIVYIASIIINAAIWGYGISGVWYVIRVVRGDAPGPRSMLRARRRQRGLCPSCGYDLRGSQGSDRCPECGEWCRS